MIVQWCFKGLSLSSDAAAKKILAERKGLVCNWWRNLPSVPPFDEVVDKLTPENIEMHVNQYGRFDPVTGDRFRDVTPFISLSAGTIERDTVFATNVAHRALRTALYFGSDFNRRTDAYLFKCWVVVSPRQSVPIEGVAEEIRDLNTYRSYSAFQTEGEIAAKLRVPATQIRHCEKWSKNDEGIFRRVRVFRNNEYIPPHTLSNIRDLI